MTTIIYLTDDGVTQVPEEISSIARKGIEGDQDAMELAKYIRQGLKLLEEVGVPPTHKLQLISEEENGDKRTFQILKKLKHCAHPLFEFRVNRSTPGAFRAIFFEFEYENEQLLIFTKSLLKQGDSNPPEFQKIIKESEILYMKFHQNPEDYLREDD